MQHLKTKSLECFLIHLSLHSNYALQTPFLHYTQRSCCRHHASGCTYNSGGRKQIQANLICLLRRSTARLASALADFSTSSPPSRSRTLSWKTGSKLKQDTEKNDRINKTKTTKNYCVSHSSNITNNNNKNVYLRILLTLVQFCV